MRCYLLKKIDHRNHHAKNPIISLTNDAKKSKLFVIETQLSTYIFTPLEMGYVAEALPAVGFLTGLE
jgi:hypothetical protein